MTARTYIPTAMKAASQEENDERLEHWRRAVAALIDAVQLWVSASSGWKVSQSDTEITEDGTGRPYALPILEITSPQGVIVLEPIAARVAGARGRVDFYGWPSLYRVMLLLQPEGEWVVRTDSGIDWPHDWGKDTFFELAKSLSRAS